MERSNVKIFAEAKQPMKCFTSCIVFLTAFAMIGLSQEKQQKKAPLSPPAQTSAAIAGKTISVKYSAPSMRGRKIFGELVPFGKPWRAGANDATALHTYADLDINGLAVPKGDYTLFVLPEANQWKLIVNKQTGQWGLTYDEKQDVGRVAMNMSRTPGPVETFKLTVSSTGGAKGQLQMEWENTVATVPFTVK